MEMSATCSSRLPASARLIHDLPQLGVRLYAADGAGPSQWLAVDALGRVRDVATAELLALAKMQLETLDALRGRRAAPGRRAG